MEILRKQAIISNQLISYLETSGSKTPIILLHGWRSESSVWKETIYRLTEQGFPCFALDLPGFGKSEQPKLPLTVGDYAKTVLDFLDKQNISSAVIVGHSFGGRIGIKLSSTHSNRINKLILVDSGGIRNPSVIRYLKQITAKIVKPIFKIPALSPIREKIYKKIGAEDYIATPQIKQTFIKIIEEDLQNDLKRINLPTLIVWGENDRETPLRDGKLMHQIVKNSKLAILEEAGHFSFLDKPEKFIGDLKKFLTNN